MDGALYALTLVTAVGCGVAGGALFAFSSFVMAALHRLPAVQGIAAMQSINVVAVTPAFMTALFGTAALCVALIVAAVLNLDESYAGWLIAGAAVYLAGVVGTTMGYHVPRNNRLAALDPTDADAARYWDRYYAEWTRWNHLRAAAGAAAAAALIVALTV